MTREPRTEAGKRLLWMFELERNGQGRIVTRTFDARLTRRIVEEFVFRIEEEAAPAVTIEGFGPQIVRGMP